MGSTACEREMSTPPTFLRSMALRYPSFFTTLRSAVGIAIPSVVCHLSVTLMQYVVHPTQRVEFFRNVFAPRCSVVIWHGSEENSMKIYATVFPREAVTYKRV